MTRSGHDIRYARSGSVNVAYEVTGSGTFDIVLVPGFVSHLEIDWDDPRSAAFLDRLGRLGRLIRFDKRGTGLSDRPPELPDLEARMDDVRAVMDAADSSHAVIFGYSEGGPIATLFAATFPERTCGLVLYGSYAKRARTDDYPWGPTFEQRMAHAEAVAANWGATDLRSTSPGADDAMATWWERRARASASPGAVRALIEMNTQIDIRSVLATVRVPTLVLHRTADTNVTVEQGRFLADHIPGARFVELPGADHAPWIDAAQVLRPIEEFLHELGAVPVAAAPPPERALAATLFTDIVSSTQMNAEIGDARWRALLDDHDRIIRDTVEAHDGRLVKSTGDGVLAVFDTPTRAVRAALDARELLVPIGIRIRAAVHVSEIESRGDDVAGLGVTVAARLMQLADADEVLVSATVRDLAIGSGFEFAERGTHTLKGVPGTWLAYAATDADGAAESQETTTSASAVVDAPRPTNLPRIVDPFLGRTDDMQRVAAAVERSRFVTLAGPGGVGKTRLAVEFARNSPYETWFVDLSRVTDGPQVPRTFLNTFGVSPRQDLPDCDRLVEALEARAVLLVVDNCEQVVDAVVEVAGRLRDETPDVRVLATSRQALNVTGEQVLVVAPLGLPDAAASVAEQLSSDAVRLFVERAERAGGVIDDVDAVVALCRRLDGIPLALELVAARMRAFSATQILEQLDAGWSVSATRHDHGPEHHRSLDDAIDWSVRLLDDGERRLLFVLSTLRGAFDLAAAAAVAGCDAMATADRLTQLVDKSLVQSITGAAGRRFRMLETVRAFARARLDGDEAADAAARHCEHFLRQSEMLGARVPGPDEDEAIEQLNVEFDDVSAAFDYACERRDADSAARLAGGPRLLVTTDGARWAQLALRVLDLPGIERTPSYVSLLAAAAWGAVLSGDVARARTLAMRAEETAGHAGAHPRLCWIWTQATGGAFADGADTCLAGAQAAGKDGDTAAESFLLSSASIYRLAAGDERLAAEHAEAALELAREIGSRSLQIRAAAALSYALMDIDAPGSRRAAEDVLAMAKPGDFHLSMPERVLAILSWRDGDYGAAADHATQAMRLIRDQGDRYVQATSVRQLAVIVGAVDHALAADLLGIAEQIVPDARVGARDAAAGAQLHALLVETFGADELAKRIERARLLEPAPLYAVIDRALDVMRAGRP